MIRLPESSRKQSELSQLDMALADPEGLVTKLLSVQDRERRVRLTWLYFTGFSLLICSIVISFVMFASPKTAGASDKTSKAWALWQSRNLVEAEKVFQEAIKENENDSSAWNGLGWCFQNTGRFAKAIEAFKKCLSIEPSHLAALNGIGQSALASKDLKTAEEYLIKASEAFEKEVPKDSRSAQNIPAAWYGLAQLYLLQENFEKAKHYAESILKYATDDQGAKSLLDQAVRRDNSLIKGEIDRIEKTLGDESQKAWELWSQGKFKEAHPLFRKVVKEDPKNSNAWNGLGWSLLNSGNLIGAMEAFQECLKVEPKHPAALNGVGQSALGTKDWKTAEEYFKKSLDQYLKSVPEEQRNAGNLPAAWIGMINLYMMTERFDEATRESEKLLKYLTGESEVKTMVTDLLDQAKKKDNSEVKKRFR